MVDNTQIQASDIAACLIRIRHTQPLIHSITNYVAMNFNANALLAIGASPLMAHAKEELVDIVSLAQALVINIGTLDKEWLASMNLAMLAAKTKAIPIIIDPVGAGATAFRTQAVLSLSDTVAPQVIRGNAAEILALTGRTCGQSKGVDSSYSSEIALQAGKQLAQYYNCVVVISGERDYIVDNNSCYYLDIGVALMTKVTAMGCTATALIAAFCAIQGNYLLASIAAMAVMGIAGEIALESAKGPGSLQVEFLDALYQLDERQLSARLKLEKIQ